jgi:hypothetical protein
LQLASYGFFTSRLLQMLRSGGATRGTKKRGGSSAALPTNPTTTTATMTHVDAAEWDRIMIASRLLTMGVALNGWAISAIRTGLLPSIFSFTVLFTGISINRVLLFLLIEVSYHLIIIT